MKFWLKLRPTVVITISAIIGIVMIISAVVELNQSKGEIFHLLSEQSSSLIETVSRSSINALNSGYEIEDLITERLFNNSFMIRNLDSLNLLTGKKLIDIGREYDLYRVNIFDKEGNKVLSSRVPEPDHIHGDVHINRYEELKPILTGKENKIVIGFKEAEFFEGQRFAVAVARANKKGAIVVNLDAKNLLEFRKKIGIGKIIRDIADNPGIEYIVLQDTLGILAASTGVDSMNAISPDKFLMNALYTDSTYQRVSGFKGHEVYEVVKRLEMDNDIIGLYRIGLSLDQVRDVEARMSGRAIIISLILAAISIIVLSIVFTQQNLKTVSNEFSRFKTFTGSILENMGEAVIVINSSRIITLFNKSAEKLFSLKADFVLQKKLSEILMGNLSFIKEQIDLMKNQGAVYFEEHIGVSGNHLFLGISINKNLDEQKQIENYTIVIKDLTDVKRFEEQVKRHEKLSAMGELASGVAHEIRNPINSIGMIAQRLNKEFYPEENRDEYINITKVLRDEVTRVNKIITQFLNYARPLDVQYKIINSKKFFDDLFLLFSEQAKQKKINLKFKSADDVNTAASFSMKIDPELVKQALINIIQNAIDSVQPNGKVELIYRKSADKLSVKIVDNGMGISNNQKKKIFELYFTTKNEGNGLGLSISQKIISQLNGSIEFESRQNEGTIFIIEFPI
jgi:PAS domain S-box-containing protein